MLIDSHCHLSFKDYAGDELHQVLERAADNDVAMMVTIGAGEGFQGNQAALALADQYPQIFCAVGMHPHDAALVTSDILQQIKNMAAHPKVVAIGEIGLDFHYEHSPRDVQKKVLEQFLELARGLGKKIAIHDRGAGDLTYQMLQASGVKENEVMIHCFTGTQELAKKYLDLGCLLSFTGIITFKKSVDLQDVVKQTPLERMLIETDSPYLAPEPYRGKTNEPAFVKYVAQKIAELKNVSFEDVARITTLNAKRFFNLPLPDLTTSIAYAIRNSLYLNITNRCTLACTFCPKFVDYEVKGYYLKLQKEPTLPEIMQAVGDPSRYDEVVFCGYGEPTRRLDDLLKVAAYLKGKWPRLKIRVNTDGLGNLVHQKNILPQLAPCVDALSVSLNAADAATYAKYCPSKYKEAAYPAVKEFIKLATQYIPDTTATVVGLPDVNQESCRRIAEDELGAKFRWREVNNVG